LDENRRRLREATRRGVTRHRRQLSMRRPPGHRHRHAESARDRSAPERSRTFDSSDRGLRRGRGAGVCRAACRGVRAPGDHVGFDPRSFSCACRLPAPLPIELKRRRGLLPIPEPGGLATGLGDRRISPGSRPIATTRGPEEPCACSENWSDQVAVSVGADTRRQETHSRLTLLPIDHGD